MIVGESMPGFSGKQFDENPDTSLQSAVPKERPSLRLRSPFLASPDDRFGSKVDLL